MSLRLLGATVFGMHLLHHHSCLLVHPLALASVRNGARRLLALRGVLLVVRVSLMWSQGNDAGILKRGCYTIRVRHTRKQQRTRVYASTRQCGCYNKHNQHVSAVKRMLTLTKCR